MFKKTVIIAFLFYFTFTKCQSTDLYEKEIFVYENDTLNYRILKPNNYDPKKKYPLHLFLHGAGERGNDNQSQLVHGAKLFLKGSIASLGSGIDKSVFSDSMKSCFESNYGVEFVDNYDDADLEMYFEVSSNDNLRRESRKQAFKSEAYLNLKLVEINSKKIILDHVIASKKASNYDFIERAGINALKDLSEESLNVFCD